MLNVTANEKAWYNTDTTINRSVWRHHGKVQLYLHIEMGTQLFIFSMCSTTRDSKHLSVMLLFRSREGTEGRKCNLSPLQVQRISPH